MARTGTVRDMLGVARAQLGYSERRDGTTMYGRHFGNPGADWCVYFLAWCASQAGCLGVMGAPDHGNTILWARWFRQHDRWRTEPKVGAVAFMSWDGHRVDDIDHVGIVEAVRPDGVVITIEGNTDDMVARRLRNDQYIVGYGYPAYAKSRRVHPRTIQIGDTGHEVKVLQRLLGDLVVDGGFGVKTRARVLVHQRAHKLAVDGIVGPLTWKSLGK